MGLTIISRIAGEMTSGIFGKNRQGEAFACKRCRTTRGANAKADGSARRLRPWARSFGVIIWRSDRSEYLIVVTTAIRTRAIWRAVCSRHGFETGSHRAPRHRSPGQTKVTRPRALGGAGAKSVRCTIAFVAPKLYQLQTLAASPSPMLTKH